MLEGHHSRCNRVGQTLALIVAVLLAAAGIMVWRVSHWLFPGWQP